MSKWYTYETMKLRIKHADSKEELEFLGRLVKSLHEAHMLTDHKRVTLLDMINKRLLKCMEGYE